MGEAILLREVRRRLGELGGLLLVAGEEVLQREALSWFLRERSVLSGGELGA